MIPKLDLNESLPISIDSRFNNLVNEYGDGSKQVFVAWDQPLRKYDLSKSLVDTTDTIKQYLIDFYESVNGSEGIFRYEDATDFSVTNTVYSGISSDKTWGIAVSNSDGSQYQLFKVYEFENVLSYRQISLPRGNGEFKLYDNGTELTTGFSLNYDTGVITLDVSNSSLNLTWSGNFDVPCRFSNDVISFIRELKTIEDCREGLYEIPSFEIEEVRRPVISHPESPILPERIEHEFLLDFLIKEQEDVSTNTSITIFDSGYEIRESNYKQEVEGELVTRSYRSFNTGEEPLANDDDLHYLLCWWHCTRGGSIVFQHQGYQVQSRENLSISVQLEINEDCENRETIYDISTLRFVETAGLPPVFENPPFTIPLEPIFVDPQDPNTASGSGNSRYQGILNGSSTAGTAPNFNIRSYSTTGVSFSQSPPDETGNNITYLASGIFWANNNLHLLVYSADSSSSYRFRVILYTLDLSNGNYNFIYQPTISQNLREFYLSSTDIQNFKIFRDNSGVNIYFRASNIEPFGSNNTPTLNGILRFNVTDSGNYSTEFIPSASLGLSTATPPTAMHDTQTWVNKSVSTYTTNTVGSIDYHTGQIKLSNTDGFPYDGSITPERDYEFNIRGSVSLESDQTYKIFHGLNEILSIYPSFAAFTPKIYVRNGDDGSWIYSILIRESCETNSFGCSTADSKNLVFMFLKSNYNDIPQLIDVQEWIQFSSQGDSHWIQTGISANNATDRLGNIALRAGNDFIYYKSGSGYGINVSSQLGFSVSSIKNRPSVTPYGFAVIAHSSNIFTDTVNLAFIQNSEV